MNPKELINEYWSRMGSNDFAFAAELFDEDFTLEWPQSDEFVIGKESFVQINQEYPAEGRWQFTVNRIVEENNEGMDDMPSVVVSDVTITDGATEARAVTFSYVGGGRILRQVEFWPENYPAPDSRAHLVERIPH